MPRGPCVAAGPCVHDQTTRQEHTSTVLAECLCDLCHVQLSLLVLAVTYAGLENHPRSAAVKGKRTPSARPTEHLLRHLPRVRRHTRVTESSEAPLVPRHGSSGSVKGWAQHGFLSVRWERAQEGGSSSDLSGRSPPRSALGPRQSPHGALCQRYLQPRQDAGAEGEVWPQFPHSQKLISRNVPCLLPLEIRKRFSAIILHDPISPQVFIPPHLVSSVQAFTCCQ